MSAPARRPFALSFEDLLTNVCPFLSVLAYVSTITNCQEDLLKSCDRDPIALHSELI